MEKAYKYLEKAALEIAYDVGGINRGRSETVVRANLVGWVEKSNVEFCDAVEAFLSKLSTEDFYTFCCGEERDRQIVGEQFDGEWEDLEGFMNSMFDEVC